MWEGETQDCRSRRKGPRGFLKRPYPHRHSLFWYQSNNLASITALSLSHATTVILATTCTAVYLIVPPSTTTTAVSHNDDNCGTQEHKQQLLPLCGHQKWSPLRRPHVAPQPMQPAWTLPLQPESCHCQSSQQQLDCWQAVQVPQQQMLPLPLGAPIP